MPPGDTNRNGIKSNLKLNNKAARESVVINNRINLSHNALIGKPKIFFMPKIRGTKMNISWG